MIGLIHLCNVYTSADNYAAPVKENLRCRFAHMTLDTQREALPLSERTELAAARRLMYDAAYAMPERAVVEQVGAATGLPDGTRWNVVYGTLSGWHGPSGAIIVNTVQLARV